jgi:predicted ATPase
MKPKLQIRNFGPIKELDIEISKFNILIGPHASGKSTIAKLLCIIHAFADFFSRGYRPFREKFLSEELYSDDGKYKLLTDLLNYYNIENFLKPNSYCFFEDERFLFEFEGNKIEIKHKQEDNAGRAQSYYVPAERIALSMISESLFELTLEQSTLSRYFLQFGRDFTIARRNQTLFNIPILNVEFEHRDGKNAVTLRDNKSLLLEETSSAIQANLPLLVILQYPAKLASLLVIEELELHSFPALQKELLNYIVERAKHESLKNAYVILPTHSPYILSAANNLLFAAKVASQNKGIADEVDKIISKDSWIAKDDFSAYYIKDGEAKSIVNGKTGLIDENELDGISEDLAGEFDALMDLYKPVNA